MIIALCAAVLGAVAYGVGSVLQAVAARRATGTAVVRHPLYLLGVACDLLGFVASLVAVHALPLFTVQSVLAGSLGVTVVLARVVLGTPVRRSGVAALLAVVTGLVVLALASGTQVALPPPSWFGAAALVAVAGGVAWLALAYRSGGSEGLALLAGAAFAGCAIGARALDLGGAWTAVLVQPVAWSIAGLGLVGSLAYARSLERGAAGPSTAIVWVVEVLVSGVVGIAVLGDHVRPGWQLPALVAVAVAVAGCALLAQRQPDGNDRLSSRVRPGPASGTPRGVLPLQRLSPIRPVRRDGGTITQRFRFTHSPPGMATRRQ